ncbi:HAD family hydrolase [Aestuariimicrobium soli]|uniref:HAD family hydrolase n=1 Tax=Aestuariimicrobium soli TaxID=2035834 RepID=UPI003EBB2C5B
MTDLGWIADTTFAAVLFDMDGTLIDSTPAVERSWQTWAREFGFDPEGVDHHGIPAETTARRVVAPDRVDEAIARINELELTDLEGVTLLPGAFAALEALTDDRRAIATSCTRPLFEARITAAGAPHLAHTVTVDDVARGKPEPDPFLRAAELLGVDPTRCLVFEDAAGGVTSAKAAGCTVIALTSSTGTADDLSHADLVVDGLDALRLVQVADGVRVTLP